MAPIVLGVRSVSHAFGPVRVLHDVKLEVARGQIVSLVGPSGCGKSTLLRAIVGTHPPLGGEIVMYGGNPPEDAAALLPDGGHRITGPGRDRGIVYQRYSLFPFLTAQDNVAIGLLLDETTLPDRLLRPLKIRDLRRRHREEAAALLERIGLGKALRRYPSELSGGMQQRVAIAQTLIMKPQVLVLDEPFGALDEATRENLQHLLLDLYRENLGALERGDEPPHTILIVTHELNEALFVADRIAGLSQYWNWSEQGHASCPGATIVYDRTAPVFEFGAEKDLAALREQREEVRAAVFEPENLQPPERDLHFWKQVEAGEAQGVLAPRG